MAKSQQTRWLRSSEVAQLAGVATNTVKRWTQAGVLRCIRLPGGGHRRFDPTEVAGFLDAAGIPLPPALRKLLTPAASA